MMSYMFIKINFLKFYNNNIYHIFILIIFNIFKNIYISGIIHIIIHRLHQIMLILKSSMSNSN